MDTDYIVSLSPAPILGLGATSVNPSHIAIPIPLEFFLRLIILPLNFQILIVL